MAKFKLTKNEQKKQKDRLKMFTRYLPTLQLKKQQLQTEIHSIEARAAAVFERKRQLEADFRDWIAVFGDSFELKPEWIEIRAIRRGEGNIAGIRIPVFESVDFVETRYDLYLTPLWIDKAIVKMKEVIALDMEIKVLNEQIAVLSRELRTATQRVNLFEKVKIPETREIIKKISIYLGDQQTSEVVRGKIAKKKLTRTAES